MALFVVKPSKLRFRNALPQFKAVVKDHRLTNVGINILGSTHKGKNHCHDTKLVHYMRTPEN